MCMYALLRKEQNMLRNDDISAHITEQGQFQLCLLHKCAAIRGMRREEMRLTTGRTMSETSRSHRIASQRDFYFLCVNRNEIAPRKRQVESESGTKSYTRHVKARQGKRVLLAAWIAGNRAASSGRVLVYKIGGGSAVYSLYSRVFMDGNLQYQQQQHHTEHYDPISYYGKVWDGQDLPTSGGRS